MIHLLHPKLKDWSVTLDPERTSSNQVTRPEFPCAVDGIETSSVYFYLDRRKLAIEGQTLSSVTRLLEKGLMFLEHGEAFRNFLFAALHTGLRPYCELAKLKPDYVVETPLGMMWRARASMHIMRSPHGFTCDMWWLVKTLGRKTLPD